MRWRSILVTIVLNIFLMLLVTILLEYVNLSDRFISLEDVVSLAAESALNSATGSEEVFSDKFQSIMTSRASSGSAKDSSINAYSSTLVYKNNEFYNVNVYKLAKYYYDVNYTKKSGSNNSYLDDNVIPTVNYDFDINTIKSEFDSSPYNYSSDKGGETRGIFEWLYCNGSIGSEYSSSWAKNSYKSDEYDSSIGTNRQMSDSFKEYFASVGWKQYTVGYLKKHTSSGSYKLVAMKYPTLLNMGFLVDSSISTDVATLTKPTSSITTDNFLSTYHIGKSYRAVNGGSFSTSNYSQANTFYYLTPMSLGVTYVPYYVFKAAFINNINTFARLKSISGSSATTQISNSLEDGSGCIETTLYNGTTTSVKHCNGSATEKTKIVNDGSVEYDLSSVLVKIDYFFIDFTTDSSATRSVISRLNGCISEASTKSYDGISVSNNLTSSRLKELKSKTLEAFYKEDSANNVNDNDFKKLYLGEDGKSGVAAKRIVARVTVKLKVHIPYKSAVLQWACRLNAMKNGTMGSNHYSLKVYQVNASGKGSIVNDNDDTWYQYTTYFMQSRV